MRAIFGDDGYARFQEFRQIRPAYEVANQIATTVGYNATPISNEQVDQMAQAIIRHAGTTRGRVNVETIDWESALSSMKSILTPEQFTAGQPTLLQLQFRSAITRAHQESVAAKSNP